MGECGCPIERAVGVLDGKWTLLILRELEPPRSNALSQLVGLLFWRIGALWRGGFARVLEFLW
jgi:hypothetical protein